MVRTLWVVRHAEREDNVNGNWHRSANPLGLRTDNTPLSRRGHDQCEELQKRFENVHFDHVFASPFDRTVDTATRLLGPHRNVPIKLEPGLCEVLYLCEKPPGFEQPEALKKRYPLVDFPGYQPVFGPDPRALPKEHGHGDDACIHRVEKTLERLLEKFRDADSLLLVTHASIVAAIHHVLVHQWTYVGQATVTKYVFNEHKMKWHCEMIGDHSHLSDPTNLRAY